jgi:hypothetical protein
MGGTGMKLVFLVSLGMKIGIYVGASRALLCIGLFEERPKAQHSIGWIRPRLYLDLVDTLGSSKEIERKMDQNSSWL